MAGIARPSKNRKRLCVFHVILRLIYKLSSAGKEWIFFVFQSDVGRQNINRPRLTFSHFFLFYFSLLSTVEYCCFFNEVKGRSVLLQAKKTRLIGISGGFRFKSERTKVNLNSGTYINKRKGSGLPFSHQSFLCYQNTETGFHYFVKKNIERDIYA